ncbi:WD40 repeat domain-containing protein [Saccharothrix saharensis]|uniref:WD40 repeat domain-containing protein n=1 Tax=Saccharothrix saharensis TaxID=571190 RepID=UPI0011534751|nr:WD40 repeat domain-containing protein [Saccharothrix saharensis]
MHNRIEGPVTGTAVMAGVIEGDVVVTTRTARAEAPWQVIVALVSLSLVSVSLAVWAVLSLEAAGRLVAVVLVLLSVSLVWWSFRAGRTATPLEERVTALRAEVVGQWRAEAAARGLQRPRPLRLRWRPTSRRARVGSAPAPPVGSLAMDPEDLRPVAHDLATAFLDGPHHQLVVLGEPGSGKTTLALLFTLAAASHDLVPVLLPVSGWHPHDPATGTGERVERWIARRVGADYGPVAEGVPVARLLPVLDGLDEMPPESLGAALKELERAAEAGLRMVLTCRGAEFEAAVVEVGALTRAAVVDIEPVRPEDVRTYLTQAEVEGLGPDRWRGVTEALTGDPGGPVAGALSTPLMISLARRVYQRPGDDPGKLTRLRTRRQVEHHLLDQFLVTVYPRDSDRARARRWLSFLAHHLRDRIGGTELEWWRLARAVPGTVMTAMVTGAVTLLGVLVGAVLTMPNAESMESVYGAAWGGVVGLAVGFLAGLNTARAAHAPDLPSRHRPGVVAARGVGRDIVTITAMLCGTAAVLLLGAFVFARPVAFEISAGIRDFVFDIPAWRSEKNVLTVLLLALIVIGIAVLTNGVGAGRAGMPHRGAPTARRLLQSLLTGSMAGLLVGTPWLIFGGIVQEMDAGARFWLSTAMLVGVPLAIGRWLAAPAPWRIAPSPLSVLRADRTATLLTGAVGGVCSGLVITAVVTLIAESPEGMLLWAVLVGSLTAVIAVFGTGTAWSVYVPARMWLALRGHLPWRLTSFLRDAHAKGILRSTGPAYQLRHNLLRDYLADHWQDTRIAGPAPLRIPRAHPALALIAAAALLTAATTLVEAQTPLHRVYYLDNYDSYWHAPTLLFSADGQRMSASAESGGWGAWEVESGSSVTGVPVTDYSTRRMGIDEKGEWCTLYREGVVKRVRCLEPALGPSESRRLEALIEDFSDEDFVVISPDGAKLAVAGLHGSLSLVELDFTAPTMTTVARTVGPSLQYAMTFSANSRVLAVANVDSISVIGIDVPRAWSQSNPGIVVDMAVSNDGEHVSTTDEDGRIHLWTRDGKHSVTTSRYASTAFSPDSRILAVAGEDGEITLWDTANRERTGVLDTHRTPIDDLAFSPDGRMLATAHGGRRVYLWHMSMP